MINEDDKLPRRRIRVAGPHMSLVDAGRGPTIIFLHGNATYSYAWRNMIPYLAFRHRCIAPDWIGMGESELIFPSGVESYPLEEKLEHLELLVEQIEPDRPIVLVTHELGATVGVMYARRNPDRMAGLVMIEGVFRVSNDTNFGEDIQDFFQRVRGEEGEDLILRENLMIEEYLPRLTSRTYSEGELERYRQPYLKPGESRRAMLSMIRQLPIQSQPGPIDRMAEENRLWCAQQNVPKLIVGGTPGFLVPPPVLATTAKWAAAKVTSVPGLHFLMEDSPARITAIILDWLDQIGHT